MSRTLTFNIPLDIPGPAAKTDTYVVPLVPLDSSTSYYARHFFAATTVKVVEAIATVSVVRPASDKAPFSAAVAFASVDTVASSVASIANGKPFADGFIQHTHRFDEGYGLRSVIRGVADAGDLPALVIKVASSWDASAVSVAAVVSCRMTLSFEGMSDKAAYDVAVALPSKK